MFFGGLFLAYLRLPLAATRRRSPPAATQLDIALGGVNTAVLIASSLTMALAVLRGAGRPPQAARRFPAR